MLCSFSFSGEVIPRPHSYTFNVFSNKRSYIQGQGEPVGRGHFHVVQPRMSLVSFSLLFESPVYLILHMENSGYNTSKENS